MFVAKYPDWVARVVFKNDETVFFDGAKDMFKYLFNLKKYAPSRTQKDISSVYVTGYYDLKPIEAGEAWFVKGSDIFGPMGHELVPFASQADAAEFSRDHKGKEILRLGDISPQVIGELN